MFRTSLAVLATFNLLFDPATSHAQPVTAPAPAPVADPRVDIVLVGAAVLVIAGALAHGH